jgi:hypothetical protein
MNKNETDDVLRPKYGKKLAIAFVLGTIVFVLIFLLGYAISSYKLQSVYQSQEQLRYELLSFQVEQELVDNSCNNFDPNRFSAEMREMGNMLDLLERRLGKDDAGVLEQKKTYSLLEARHFLYLKAHNENCPNNTMPTILFFYSNTPESVDEAQKLGYMLTYLWEKNPNITIYSFEYDLDSEVVRLLKEKYHVTQSNVLVIRDQTLLNIFEKSDDIERALKNIYSY